MKLSQYAKKLGVCYKTAWRYYTEGVIKGYQTPTGTIIITEEDVIKTNYSSQDKDVLVDSIVKIIEILMPDITQDKKDKLKTLLN